SSATTLPGGTVAETPFRISLSPSRSATSLMTKSGMEAHSETHGDEKPDADHDDVDDRQRRNEIDRAGAPQRDQQRADHFGARPEQVSAGGLFAPENEEPDHPARQHAVLDQRNSDVAFHPRFGGADRARGFFQLRPDLQQRAGDEPHPVSKPDDGVGDP